MLLITNRNNPTRNDRLEFYLNQSCQNTHVNIAVAFFTEHKVIEDMLAHGCTIDLIVRLNDGTSPEALRRVYRKPNIRVKYFTSVHFHPKLYVIPHDCAFIGSSNLTKSALNTNNEINLKVEYEEELFSELEGVFMEYWEQAATLDADTLSKFEALMGGRGVGYRDFSKELGDISFNNVADQNPVDRKKTFIDGFKKDYEGFVAAFRTLEEYYTAVPGRRWDDAVSPLRIEVDRFLWWLGETQYSGEEYKINRRYPDTEIRSRIARLKSDFLHDDRRYLNKAPENYRTLNDSFGSRAKIASLDEDTLFAALCDVYSFHDSSQWHKGGIDALRKDFFSANGMARIKETISYLLFGEDGYIERLYNCIHGEYRLKNFGESSVKELFGYINPHDLPTFNLRIKKSMEWLGFGKL